MTTKRRLPSSLFFFLILALVCGCAGREVSPSGENPALKDPLTLSGLVSDEGSGFEGATIQLFPLDSFSGPHTRPTVAETLSDNTGRFELQVEKGGDYILVAYTDPINREGKFAYFGRNPIRARAHQRGLSLPLVETIPITWKAGVGDGEEFIAGVLYSDGTPIEGAKVMAYLKPDAGFRGQPYAFSLPTGPDGAFHIRIEPGTYYIVAKKRTSGNNVGPLAPGDLFAIHPQLRIELGKETGAFADMNMVTVPSFERQARHRTKFATITGTIVDELGNPLEGMRALLYDNPRMLGEPLTLSAPTAADGKFNLRATNYGNFYLGARENLGGPPISGELVGFAYSENNGEFHLSPGTKITKIEITVRAVP